MSLRFLFVLFCFVFGFRYSCSFLLLLSLWPLPLRRLYWWRVFFFSPSPLTYPFSYTIVTAHFVLFFLLSSIADALPRFSFSLFPSLSFLPCVSPGCLVVPLSFLVWFCLRFQMHTFTSREVGEKQHPLLLRLLPQRERERENEEEWMNEPRRNTHKHTHTHTHIYIQIRVSPRSASCR